MPTYDPQSNTYYEPSPSYTPPANNYQVTQNSQGGYNYVAGTNSANPQSIEQQIANGAVSAQPQVQTQQPNPLTFDPKPYTQAFEQVKDTAAPQENGLAVSAIQQTIKAQQEAPKFYLPGNTPGHAPETVFNAKGQPLTAEQYKAQSLKGDFSDVTKGPVPVPNATPIQGIEAQLAADPVYNEFLKEYGKLTGIEEQRASLTDEYKKIVKSSGLEELNTEIMNMKSVIEGTEDDIRLEVKATNGFATDSQVQALASARNKTLIKQYNKLVDQQTNLTNQVNTMVNLAAQDREYALQVSSQKLNIISKISEYKDRFISNAREGYNNYIKAVGYSGLYNALANDPQSMAMAEKTLGIPSGTIAQAAQKEQAALAEEARQQQFKEGVELAKLSMDEARLGLEKQRVGLEGARLNLSRQELAYKLQKDEEEKQGKVLGQEIAKTQDLAQNKAKVDLIGSILTGKNLSSVVGPNSFTRVADTSGFWNKLNPVSQVRNLLSPNRSNVVGEIEQLRSQLNLDALIKAKGAGATFGALSDQELKILSSSATKLGTWAIKDKSGNVIGYNAKESDFRKELDKINNFAKLDYVLKGGNPQEVGVQIINGELWTKNSNGSMTKIY